MERKVNNYAIESIFKAHDHGIITVPSDLMALLNAVHCGGEITNAQWIRYQHTYDDLLKQTKLWMQVWRGFLGLQMQNNPQRSSYVYLINSGFVVDNAWCPARQMFFGTHKELMNRFIMVFKDDFPKVIQQQLRTFKNSRNWYFLSILCTIDADYEVAIGNHGSYEFIISHDFNEQFDDTLPRISYNRDSPEKAHAMLLSMNPDATHISQILELSRDHILTKEEITTIINDEFILNHASVHQKSLYNMLMCYAEQKDDNSGVQNTILKALNDNNQRIHYLKKMSRWSYERLVYVIKTRPEDVFSLFFTNPSDRTVNAVFTYVMKNYDWYTAFEELLDCVNQYLPVTLPDEIIAREEIDFCLHGTVDQSWTWIQINFDFIGHKVDEQRMTFSLMLKLDEFYEFLEDRCDKNDDLEKALVWESDKSVNISEGLFDDEEDDEEEEEV
jgi:hypothetical protein